MTLDELAIKYDCDKASVGGNPEDPSIEHDYAKIYDQFFTEFRYNPVNLLEIGVLHGNSLNLWYKYFPSANIYGIDIREDCKEFENDRIKIFIGNQSDKDFLINTFQNIVFDIIIDDGSHKATDQIPSFEVLFNFLKPKGLYIIEDLECSFDSNNTSSSLISLLKDKLDLVLRRKKCEIESIHFSSELCIIVKGENLG